MDEFMKSAQKKAEEVKELFDRGGVDSSGKRVANIADNCMEQTLEGGITRKSSLNSGIYTIEEYKNNAIFSHILYRNGEIHTYADGIERTKGQLKIARLYNSHGYTKGFININDKISPDNTFTTDYFYNSILCDTESYSKALATLNNGCLGYLKNKQFDHKTGVATWDERSEFNPDFSSINIHSKNSKNCKQEDYITYQKAISLEEGELVEYDEINNGILTELNLRDKKYTQSPILGYGKTGDSTKEIKF